MGTYCISKYTFLAKKQALEWYANPYQENHSPFQYSTRLYSFFGDKENLNNCINDYTNIIDHILKLYEKNVYIDIEHTTYLKIPETRIIEMNCIGVKGQFAEAPDIIINE